MAIQLTPQKQWKKNNPEKAKAQKQRWNHKSRFGLTTEEYNSKFKKTPFCAICGNDKDLVLDHCHKTKNIRDVLCRKCNSGIGLLQDDVKLLEKALEYLQKWQSH